MVAAAEAAALVAAAELAGAVVLDAVALCEAAGVAAALLEAAGAVAAALDAADEAAVDAAALLDAAWEPPQPARPRHAARAPAATNAMSFLFNTFFPFRCLNHVVNY